MRVTWCGARGVGSPREDYLTRFKTFFFPLFFFFLKNTKGQEFTCKADCSEVGWG